MLLDREPAIWAAALAAIIQGALIFLHKDPTAQLPGWEVWLTPIVTVVAGFFTRQKVIPTETIKQAGLSPRSVKERAADPRFMPHTGP